MRDRGLEDGITVAPSKSYESEWTLDPLVFEDSRIENSKGMNDLAAALIGNP